MRKALLLLIVAISVSTVSFSQITKGSIFLGGDLGLSTQSTKGPSTGTLDQSGFNISPVIGKAVRENLILGVRLSYANSEIENYNGPGSEYKTSTYGVGAFIRKYKPLGKSGFYLFLQGGLNGEYMDGKMEQVAQGHFDNAKTVTVSVNVYPGISYAVSKRFHIESGFNNLISASYSNQKRTVTDFNQPVKYTTNGFGLSSSLNNSGSPFYVGFRVLLGK